MTRLDRIADLLSAAEAVLIVAISTIGVLVLAWLYTTRATDDTTDSTPEWVTVVDTMTDATYRCLTDGDRIVWCDQAGPR